MLLGAPSLDPRHTSRRGSAPNPVQQGVWGRRPATFLPGVWGRAPTAAPTPTLLATALHAEEYLARVLQGKLFLFYNILRHSWAQRVLY